MEGREGKGRVGCGARSPAGARGPALAKDGPDHKAMQIRRMHVRCTNICADITSQ